MRKRKNTNKYFSEMALALALLIGAFSIFSVAFGVQKSYIFQVRDNDQDYYQAHFKLKHKKERVREKKLNEQKQKKYDNPFKNRYILQHLEKLGAIHARSFLVGDLDTGEIIFERKANNQFPIASLTKYFTAFTAAKILEPNELAKITTEKLKVEGNRAHFRIGDNLSIRNLLYPLLLVSSNDAGEIIARQRNRKMFITQMNNIANIYQLKNTSFEDPTGLSKNNKSTAKDLFKFMRIIRDEFPQIVNISSLNTVELHGYTWRNINRASQIKEFFGGKTGYTNAARQTSIGYYKIKLANDQIKNIAIVILQSDQREKDTKNIINYLKKYVAYI